MIMKKFITIIVALILLCTGCTRKEYVLTYKVYYPDNTVTKVYEYQSVFTENDVNTYSDRGSNYLFVRGKGRIEATTAPIEIVSVKRK